MTDWPVKTLGDVCDVIAGQSPEGKFYNKEGNGVPFYQGKKDFAERVLGSPTTWTSEVTKLARPGDILMSVRAPVGPVNLCPIEACIGRGLAAIRPSSKTDTDFIYYYLESIQSEIAGTEGAVFASINKAQIEGLRCPVPPLEEQKRIVALLDAATERVTELTACYEQARTHANNLFTSALRDALESNPDWPVKTLGDICELISRGRPPCYCEVGGIVVLNQKCVRNGKIELGPSRRTDNHFKAVPEWAYLRKGDTLINSTGAGTLGRVSFVAQLDEPTTFDTHLTVVRPLTGVCWPAFAGLVLNGREKDIVDLAGGATGQTELPREAVRSFEIPVPPLEAQKQIVARLDLMRAKTSEMVAAYDTKLTAAKNLRQSILEAAFEGDL